MVKGDRVNSRGLGSQFGGVLSPRLSSYTCPDTAGLGNGRGVCLGAE